MQINLYFNRKKLNDYTDKIWNRQNSHRYWRIPGEMPSCESDQWAEILVSSVYSHFCYVPIMPSDKDAMIICKKCGLKRYGVTFDSKLISNYSEVKKLYRHKWFTYIGVGIIALPIVLWLIFLVFKYL